MLNTNAIITNNSQFTRTLETLKKHPEKLHAACVFAATEMLKLRGDNSGLINGNASPTAQIVNVLGAKEVGLVRKWFKTFVPELVIKFDDKLGKYTASKQNDVNLTATPCREMRLDACLTIGPLDKPKLTEEEEKAAELARLKKLGGSFVMANKLTRIIEDIERLVPFMREAEALQASVFLEKVSGMKLTLSEGKAARNAKVIVKAQPKVADMSAIETHRAQVKAVGKRAMSVTKIDKSHNSKAPRGVGIESIKAVSAALAG